MYLAQPVLTALLAAEHLLGALTSVPIEFATWFCFDGCQLCFPLPPVVRGIDDGAGSFGGGCTKDVPMLALLSSCGADCGEDKPISAVLRLCEAA